MSIEKYGERVNPIKNSIKQVELVYAIRELTGRDQKRVSVSDVVGWFQERDVKLGDRFTKNFNVTAKRCVDQGLLVRQRRGSYKLSPTGELYLNEQIAECRGKLDQERELNLLRETWECFDDPEFRYYNQTPARLAEDLSAVGQSTATLIENLQWGTD